MFCPKCGSILLPEMRKDKRVFTCSCGYRTIKLKEAKIKESIKPGKTNVEVVENEEAEHLPLMEAECPKCGNKKAYFWTVQTRAGDEPETKFLKCKKCKHIWRDYN